MKKTILTMVVTASLAAASQASAMDVNAQNMAPDVSANNYFSENSFEEYGNPQSGYFVAVHGMTGQLDQTSLAYNYGGNLGGNNSILNASTHSVSGFGVSFGHQDSEITDNLARFLQIKRVSYALEVDSASGTTNGNMTTNGLPFTYNAGYKSLSILATGKINVFKVWRFSPYFEFGGGIAHQTLSDYNYTQLNVTNTKPVQYPDATDTGAIYETGIGVDVFVSSHFDASVGYRATSADDLVVSKTALNNTRSLAESPRFQTDQHQWIMSIAYDF